MTQVMGMPYAVDHIIPLNHPRVCGLHIALNMKVVTAGFNFRKGNYFCPEQMDMFPCPQIELI
jgi:hypothetical protein